MSRTHQSCYSIGLCHAMLENGGSSYHCTQPAQAIHTQISKYSTRTIYLETLLAILLSCNSQKKNISSLRLTMTAPSKMTTTCLMEKSSSRRVASVFHRPEGEIIDIELVIVSVLPADTIHIDDDTVSALSALTSCII